MSEARELEEILVAVARTSQERAYAPYSKYQVGAALLTKSGKIFHGCNVENATYGATICAERSAIVQMIAAGESAPSVCVIVTTGEEPATPCGICRQVLAEFANDMPVLLVAYGKRGEVRRRTTLAKLLPDSFGPEHLAVSHPASRKKALPKTVASKSATKSKATDRTKAKPATKSPKNKAKTLR